MVSAGGREALSAEAEEEASPGAAPMYCRDEEAKQRRPVAILVLLSSLTEDVEARLEAMAVVKLD